jgi:hypothetical protein
MSTDTRETREVLREFEADLRDFAAVRIGTTSSNAVIKMAQDPKLYKDVAEAYWRQRIVCPA